jgi:8-oxo-dGTP diphosphatase
MENFIQLIQTSKEIERAAAQEGQDKRSPSTQQLHPSDSGHVTVGELAQYETPLVTVDIVVFTIQQHHLRVLLIQRKQPPYDHMWAIPGGFIREGETLQEAAGRRLWEETNVSNIYLEQLHAFGRPDRDPRARVITVAYSALVSEDRLRPEARANAEDVRWFDVTQLPELAFDHGDIVQTALQRLKDRLENSPIAFQLLPPKFTLTELQRVYELILGRMLDKRNFRKKILGTNLLEDLGETKMEGFHRPAQLYAFKQWDKTVSPPRPTQP